MASVGSGAPVLLLLPNRKSFGGQQLWTVKLWSSSPTMQESAS